MPAADDPPRDVAGEARHRRRCIHAGLHPTTVTAANYASTLTQGNPESDRSCRSGRRLISFLEESLAPTAAGGHPRGDRLAIPSARDRKSSIVWLTMSLAPARTHALMRCHAASSTPRLRSDQETGSCRCRRRVASAVSGHRGVEPSRRLCDQCGHRHLRARTSFRGTTTAGGTGSRC